MTKKAFRNYHKFHGLGGDGYTKDTRTSEDIWNSWHRNFGGFENLQGARQSIWEITDAVRIGRAEGNPANLYDCSHRFAHHAEEQTQLAKDAGTLSSLLQGVWTGDAAAVARSRFDEFAASATTTAEVLGTNATNLDTQAEQFRVLSEQLKPMPPLEQTRQELFSQHRWTCDSVWTWQEPYLEAAQENNELYTGYHTSTQQNIGQVGADYGSVAALPADTEITIPPSVTAPSGGAVPGYGSPDIDGVGGLGGSGYTPNDTTRTAGFVPGGEGLGGAGGLGSGAGSGYGPGGSGAGGLGAGAAAGAGAGGGIPGRMGGGGVPPGGAAARGGAGGMMGGGGAGGGRGGKQSEDEEHRRKVGLNEDDPYSLFGLVDPTVPPVIGDDR